MVPCFQWKANSSTVDDEMKWSKKCSKYEKSKTNRQNSKRMQPGKAVSERKINKNKKIYTRTHFYASHFELPKVQTLNFRCVKRCSDSFGLSWMRASERRNEIINSGSDYAKSFQFTLDLV